MYYDIYLDGQFIFHIKELHEKYGPVIRVGPEELHVNTQDFHSELYGSIKRDKWNMFTDQFGTPDATFATCPAKEHTMRRKALNPFFSKETVRRLQPVIQDKVSLVMVRLAGFKKSGKPLDLRYLFTAFTNDVVESYAFGRSAHRIEAEDFDPSFHDASISGTIGGIVFKHCPWVIAIMQKLPPWVVIKMDPNMASYVDLQTRVQKQVRDVQQGVDNNIEKGYTHGTIFQEIHKSGLPQYEKSFSRLWQDGQVTVVAGSLTTAWTLCCAVTYLSFNPDMLKTLKAELREAGITASALPSLVQLEKLTYLTAVIQETIRLSYGVTTRNPRILRNETLTVKDGDKTYVLPPDIPISMSTGLLHHDEKIFPDSHAFKPQRWLETPHLDKYLVSFGKGSRQCIGINLAYAELYMMMCAIFSTYGTPAMSDDKDQGIIELFETDLSDIVLARDLIIPMPKKDTKGVRIKVR